MLMKQKSRLVRALMVFALAAALCGLLIWQHTAAIDLLCRLTLREAALLLPTAEQTDAPEKAEPETAGTTQTAATTAAKAPETTAKQEKNATDLTETPADIRKLIQEAETNAAKEKKAGAIQKKTYTTEGVTDRTGVVRIKNLNQTRIDPAALLGRRADLAVEKGKPCVLVFHTHTTESYQYLDRSFYTAGFPTRDRDSSRNMVRVGDEICEELERMGFPVLHDTEIHDTRYNGAYERSRRKVLSYLEQYPTLQVLLDIHRDAIQLSDGTKIKPVAEIDGKQAAQVMIISGCQESGNKVTDFPDWEQNLVFALQLQQKLESTFPGLTRPLFFAPRRYNMHLSHCSLLLEVGTDANTLEEAAYSGRLIGHALALLLEEYRKENA